MTSYPNDVDYAEDQPTTVGDGNTVKTSISFSTTGNFYFSCISVGMTGGTYFEAFLWDGSGIWVNPKIRQRTSTDFYACGIIFDQSYDPGVWDLYFTGT